jgi:hypothetical protein
MDAADPASGSSVDFLQAVERGDLAVAARLLNDTHIDSAARDNYAIRIACTAGRAAVVDLLLGDARGDPAATDNEAILLASENGHLPVVDRLL